MSNAARNTQKIQADAARIASLRMELIEEMNGLDAHAMVHERMVQHGAKLQDRNTLSLSSADFQCALLAFDAAQGRRRVLPEDDPTPEPCEVTESLEDAEMFARHGGDV